MHVLLFAVAFAAQLDAAYEHYVHDRFLPCATEAARVSPATRASVNLHVVCLMGAKKDTDALSILEKYLASDQLSAQGPWLEGRVYRAWLAQRMGNARYSLEDLPSLSVSGPDKLLNGYLLSQIYLQQRKAKRAMELLQPFIASKHPLEHAARFTIAAAMIQLSVDDAAYIESAISQLKWLVDHETDPQTVTLLKGYLSDVEITGRGRVRKSYDKLSLTMQLRPGISGSIRVPDPYLGVDPTVTRDEMSLSSRASLLVGYRVLWMNDHTVDVAYAGQSLFHFSTDLFGYDQVSHGPVVDFKTRLKLMDLPIGIGLRSSLISQEANLSRIDHVGLGHTQTLLAQMHLSRRFGLALEGSFSQVYYSDYTDPGTTQQLFFEGNSGNRLGFAIKTYVNASSFPIISAPLELIVTVGTQFRQTDVTLFERTSYLFNVETWVDARWGIRAGLSQLGMYSQSIDAARASEIYTETHFRIDKAMSSEVSFGLDNFFTYRSSPTPLFSFKDFQSLLHLTYRY